MPVPGVATFPGVQVSESGIASHKTFGLSFSQYNWFC